VRCSAASTAGIFAAELAIDFEGSSAGAFAIALSVVSRSVASSGGSFGKGGHATVVVDRLAVAAGDMSSIGLSSAVEEVLSGWYSAAVVWTSAAML
jgi:hypothetical protein